MTPKQNLKEITNYIRKIIDDDEEVDVYTLFDILDIIDDKKYKKLRYERYIKPYIS